MADGRLEEIQRPQDVDVSIPPRVPRGHRHAHLRGMVTDDLRPKQGDDPVQGRVPDVCLPEPNPIIQILSGPRGQIVHDPDFVAFGQKCIRHMRSDESCAARDENAHPCAPL